VRIHCDAKGAWVMDVRWGRGASGAWPLRSACPGPCLPYATPDINGDGRAELLLWSRDEEDPLGFVTVFDMNPSEAAGVPVAVRAIDGARLDRRFAVGLDDRRYLAVGCDGGAFSWRSLTRRAGGRWDERASLFDFTSGRTSGRPGLQSLRATRRVVRGPGTIQSQVCGAPILLGGAGSATAILPAERLGGVPFPVCDVTRTPLQYGPAVRGAAVVFSRASGATCRRPGSDWFLGVSEEKAGETLAAFGPIVGCATRCWAYGAFETFDTDGAWDVGVGIQPSTSTIRLYDVGTGPGDWRVETVVSACGTAPDCLPTPFQYGVGSSSGETSGLSCHVSGGRVTGLVLWSRRTHVGRWSSARLVFHDGAISRTDERRGRGRPPPGLTVPLGRCLGAVTSAPPSSP
jgi:hypothetical protein